MYKLPYRWAGRCLACCLLLMVALPTTAQDTPEPITPANAVNLTLVQTLVGHDLTINDLTFTPDGDLLSASDDITARLWDLDASEAVWVLDGQMTQVRSVAVSPDGATVLTTGFQNEAFLWDVPSRTRGAPIAALAAFNDGVFAPDGNTFALAVGDGTVRVYTTPPTVADLISEPQRTIPADALQVTSIAYSPDGTRIAAGHGFPSDRALVWDTETGDTRLTLAAHTGTVHSVAYHADGTRIATGGGDGALIVWDADTGDTLYTVDAAHSGGVFDVAFAPAGDVLASVGFDGVLRLWDATDGTPLAEYTADEAALSLNAVDFSADGGTVAAGGEAAAVWVWRVAE